ncbi:MAG: hypothetical protein WD800_03310, partial [Dehalococcoidia bacterium]
MSSRQFTLTASALSFVLAVSLSLVLFQPAAAQTAQSAPATGGDAGLRIVQTATGYLHQVEGQCFPWVRRVVEQATGDRMGFGYRDGYIAGGAVEVPVSDVRAGDVIQIADDANLGPNASYPGLHTAIVIAWQDDGRLLVIDSNSQWDGVVRLRADYDPVAAANRNATLTAPALRFGASGKNVGNTP